jgi:hypothetical protein
MVMIDSKLENKLELIFINMINNYFLLNNIRVFEEFKEAGVLDTREKSNMVQKKTKKLNKNRIN